MLISTHFLRLIKTMTVGDNVWRLTHSRARTGISRARPFLLHFQWQVGLSIKHVWGRWHLDVQFSSRSSLTTSREVHRGPRASPFSPLPRSSPPVNDSTAIDFSFSLALSACHPSWAFHPLWVSPSLFGIEFVRPLDPFACWPVASIEGLTCPLEHVPEVFKSPWF